jgi:hypothetical protein
VRTRLAQALALIGAVTVLVLAANTVALAANGKGFLLGKTNKASKVTTLKRTNPGPALSLKTKSGPPLAVSSSTKVTKLNADQVDGKSASAFAPSSVAATVTALGELVDGIGDHVGDLGIDVAALADRVDTADALAPIAAGYIESDGTLGNNRGIDSASYSSGSYLVKITGENYFYTKYAPTVTPECDKVTVITSSAGGYLFVSFADAVTGAAKPCAFAVSVIKLTN